VRAAYADPPYIGQAARHYNSEEVDHVALLERLAGEYEAWALSASAPSLSVLIPLLPPGTRTGIWVKPFASWKPNVYPSYSWEPVIFFGGRKRKPPHVVRDWVSANITLQKGLSGVKPREFCWWVFDMLGLEPDDILDDLFPGSGTVGRAWTAYQDHRRVAQMTLAL